MQNIILFYDSKLTTDSCENFQLFCSILHWVCNDSLGHIWWKVVFFQIIFNLLRIFSLQTTCFNDPVVEEAMLRVLQECGVQMYTGFLLAQWNDGRDSTEISSACFTSADEPLKLDCSVSLQVFLSFVTVERKISKGRVFGISEN